MPKRRERDRPKCAPTSLYNPHKRVLLNYDSDDAGEEVQAEPDVTKSPSVADNARADYKITAYIESDEGEDVNAAAPTVSTQQDGHEDADEVVADAKTSKRNAGRVKTSGRHVATRNVATGQYPALGSASYSWEDDEEEAESEEDEAMAYLRAVRSERQNMPEILVAPRDTSDEHPYTNGVGDHRGMLDDGAYVACASLGPSLPESAKTSVEPQEAFTTTLKRRFHVHRARMHHPPVAEVVTASDNSPPNSSPSDSRKAYAKWQRFLRHSSPQSTHLQAMEQPQIFELLELLQKHFLLRTHELSPTTSAWIWALFARLDDVGTMNNDQVWTLREFGKKAVLVQVSLDDPVAAEMLEREAAEQQDLEEQDELNASSSESADSESDADGASPISAAPKKSGEKLDINVKSNAKRENTLATLDMIITIVGEVFGQRDLLEFRKPWNTTEDASVAV